ncbi:MAG: DUF4149 domain-containing protein [Pyrinomonadaceae bacterium]
MNLLFDIRILLLGLWLGAACFFSFAVAPGVFAVLPSRELAGSVVNRTLAIINYSGMFIGLILLASSYVSRQNINRIRLWLEQGTLLFFAAACAFGQFVIAARLHDLRASIGRPIDEVALDDPLRVAFDNLHAYSVTILSVAMITALVAFFLLVRRARNFNNL